MNWPEVSAIATVIIAGGVLFGFIGWGLRAFIREEIAGLQKEMKPNGGASFRDEMMDRFDQMDDRLTKLEKPRRRAAT